MQSNGLSADISLNPSPFPHQPQNPQTAMQFQHPQIVSYANNPNPQTQPLKQSFQYVPPKPKQLSPLSDEDDNTGSGSGAGFNPDSTTTTPDGKRKFSPWQRMKWTDTMVRFLIVAVFYIGDDGGSESADPSMKKCNGGFLQKKGKWKSVSKAMMEKGFCVSPQQCEDKFNDLNKRYKRVNDILGKGTACRVVENQSLLESMDLSPKMKNEVKKLLNSKHLFFREMCAYHNSCGHLTSNGAASNEHPHQQQQQQQTHQKQDQETCSHSSDTSSIQNLVNSNRCEVEGSKLATIVESEDDSDDVSEGYSDDDSENEDADADQDHEEDENSSKRRRKGGNFASSVNQLNLEASVVMQDSTKSAWEKKQWIKTKMMQLEDQQLGYKRDALELEKQRLKWMKFSSKKEREMERAKLENDRKRFENERLVLTMKQKEFELLDLHHQNHQLCHSPINRL